MKEDDIAYFKYDKTLLRVMTINQLDKLSARNDWFKTDENYIGAYFEK